MTPLSALIAHIVHVAVSGLRRMFLRIVLCKFIGNGYSFCIEVKKKKKKKNQRPLDVFTSGQQSGVSFAHDCSLIRNSISYFYHMLGIILVTALVIV